jgi:hypothetical protein
MWACKYTLEDSADQSMQMAIRRSFAKATGGKEIAPPQCNRCVDSWDDDSVAADQSNLCGPMTINADDDTEDTINARRYAGNAAKAKAEADKEVGEGDA